MWGDGGYQGQAGAIDTAVPKAQDMTCRGMKYKDHVDEEARRKNTTKARVRAKVEHPFRILKRVFGFTKVRYRGYVEESSVAARGLSAGQPAPTPQPANPVKGVVSLETGISLAEMKRWAATRTL